MIPGAKIELVSEETGLKREATTGTNGQYSFSLLPIGEYSLRVSQSGFRTVVFKDLRLAVGDNRVLDIQMEVSSIETQVTVESVLAPSIAVRPWSER